MISKYIGKFYDGVLSLWVGVTRNLPVAYASRDVIGVRLRGSNSNATTIATNPKGPCRYMVYT